MKRWTQYGIGIALAVLLAACSGGESEQGVTLQEVGDQRPTATQEPTSEPVEATARLDGRLLYLKGRTFVLRDLATGEETVFDAVESYSSAVFDTVAERGVFVSLTDVGVLDLKANTVFAMSTKTASFVSNIGLSPDGRWAVASPGGYRTRLQLFDLDGAREPQLVAMSGQAFYSWAWTPDGQLVWWNALDPERQTSITDLATLETTPVEAGTGVELASFPGGTVSPDGTQAVQIPVMLVENPLAALNPLGTVAAAPADQSDCFDSRVELVPLPLDINAVDQNAQVVWNESGLIASSPQWVDATRLLFVRWGYGVCGEVSGEPERAIVLYDLSSATPPRLVAGPVGNLDDPNDEAQVFARILTHLYAVSPDGQYVAWVGGGLHAGESVIYVTHIDSGDTQTVVRITEGEAQGYANYIEKFLIRQVIWLE